jgi:hypothetical protein
VQGDTELEVALRQSLAQAAAGIRPARADLAGRVTVAGRRRRVARAPVAALSVVAATMVASGVLFHAPEPTVSPYYGVALVEPTPQSTPAPSSTVERPARTADPMPELDGRVGRIVPDAGAGDLGASLVLASNDGTGIDLRHVRGVVAAYRIGSGWALVTGGDHPRLYWVSEREPPTLVLAGLDALAVDRAQVAWRRGPAMSTATISPAGKLEDRVEVRTAEDSRDPVGFLGEAVLLRDPDASAAPWGIWRPAHDDYRPFLPTQVAEIFGTLPDGRTAVGLIPVGAGRCLALLDVDQGLTVGKTACLPLVPASGHPVVVSPDGRWLIATAATTAETAGGLDADNPPRGATVLVDLTAAFAGSADAVTEVEGVPGPSGRALWPDAATVIYPADGGVVQLRPAALVAGGEDAAELWPTSGDLIVLVEV